MDKIQKPNNPEWNLMLCIPQHISFEVIKSRLRWAHYVARMEKRESVYKHLVWKPDGRRPLERPRFAHENNIKMDLPTSELLSMDSIDLAQNRDTWRAVVSAVMKFGFHKMQ